MPDQRCTLHLFGKYSVVEKFERQMIPGHQLCTAAQHSTAAQRTHTSGPHYVPPLRVHIVYPERYNRAFRAVTSSTSFELADDLALEVIKVGKVPVD